MKINEVLRGKGDSVVDVAPDATVWQAIATLGQHNIGAAVIRGADGGVRGILSERDVVRRLWADGPGLLDELVQDVMTSPVVTCGPEQDIDEVMRLMTERRIRHLPVVADGALCGILSIGDVVKSRIGELQTTAEHLVSYINGG